MNDSKSYKTFLSTTSGDLKATDITITDEDVSDALRYNVYDPIIENPNWIIPPIVHTKIKIDKTGCCVSLRTMNMLERAKSIKFDEVNKATIVRWDDNDKTVVRASKDDTYDKMFGVLLAYFQKTSGMSKTQANKFLESITETTPKDKK